VGEPANKKDYETSYEPYSYLIRIASILGGLDTIAIGDKINMKGSIVGSRDLTVPWPQDSGKIGPHPQWGPQLCYA
jgi:hypothetical protein